MHDVAFYLLGVSFVFKTNPLSVAIAPKARVEKKRGRSTDHHCKGLERPSQRKAVACDGCHRVQQGGLFFASHMIK